MFRTEIQVEGQYVNGWIKNSEASNGYAFFLTDAFYTGKKELDEKTLEGIANEFKLIEVKINELNKKPAYNENPFFIKKRD